MSKRKTSTKKTVQVTEPTQDGGSSSSSTSSSTSLKDFLGMPPSGGWAPAMVSGSSETESGQGEHEVTGSEEDDAGSDDNNNNDDDDGDDDDVDDANRSSSSPSSSEHPDNRHSKRKQNKPKKYKNRVSKEITRLQNSSNLLIPRLPFQRVVREVLQNVSSVEMRLQSTALDCLRESAESYLVNLFEDAVLTCLHRQRVTVAVKDVRLVQIIRGQKDPGRR